MLQLLVYPILFKQPRLPLYTNTREIPRSLPANHPCVVRGPNVCELPVCELASPFPAPPRVMDNIARTIGDTATSRRQRQVGCWPRFVVRVRRLDCICPSKSSFIQFLDLFTRQGSILSLVALFLHP